MQAVAALWRRNAFVLGSVVTGAKTCVADILVQTGYEGRESIDWRRNFVFSSFGLCYLGAFQYVQYTLWFPRLFPGTGPTVGATRVTLLVPSTPFATCSAAASAPAAAADALPYTARVSSRA